MNPLLRLPGKTWQAHQRIAKRPPPTELWKALDPQRLNKRIQEGPRWCVWFAGPSNLSHCFQYITSSVREMPMYGRISICGAVCGVEVPAEERNFPMDYARYFVECRQCQRVLAAYLRRAGVHWSKLR